MSKKTEDREREKIKEKLRERIENGEVMDFT